MVWLDNPRMPVTKSTKPAPRELPEVHFSDHGDVRCLHLGATEWIQGSMLMDEPYTLELEYVQRMMAWLLFVPPTSVSKRHAMQLGLGAAALTKFCHKKLRMKTTVIELNPQVVAACWGWFRLPLDNDKLQVIIEDAEQAVQDSRWHGTVDALQVDLYDHEAAGPVLDGEDFYAHCRQMLTDDGCMTVNLFGRDSSYQRSLQTLARVFGPEAVWAFKPTREGNTVVLAQRTPLHPPREVLAERSETIQTRWGLPATKWMRVFKPLAISTP
jgi:spermidine synthase